MKAAVAEAAGDATGAFETSSHAVKSKKHEKSSAPRNSADSDNACGSIAATRGTAAGRPPPCVAYIVVYSANRSIALRATRCIRNQLMLMPAECGGAALPRNAQRHFPKTGL